MSRHMWSQWNRWPEARYTKRWLSYLCVSEYLRGKFVLHDCDVRPKNLHPQVIAVAGVQIKRGHHFSSLLNSYLRAMYVVCAFVRFSLCLGCIRQRVTSDRAKKNLTLILNFGLHPCYPIHPVQSIVCSYMIRHLYSKRCEGMSWNVRISPEGIWWGKFEVVKFVENYSSHDTVLSL